MKSTGVPMVIFYTYFKDNRLVTVNDRFKIIFWENIDHVKSLMKHLHQSWFIIFNSYTVHLVLHTYSDIFIDKYEDVML